MRPSAVFARLGVVQSVHTFGMNTTLIILLVVFSVAVALTLALTLRYVFRRSKTVSLNFGSRRVVRESLPPVAPEGDIRAVKAYRKILSAHLHPSKTLLDGMSAQECSALAELGTDAPIVLAYATHPHRRNDILNLIAACEHEFLIVVGDYTQGLVPKRGRILSEFKASSFASFIYDGTLGCNPRFLRLAEEKEGLTVAGHFYALPSAPTEPLDTAEFSYIIDPDSDAFRLDTHGRTKLVFRPDSDILSVKSHRGRMELDTEDGTVRIVANGCQARLVWTNGGPALRISSKVPAQINFGESKKTAGQMREAHKMFLSEYMLVDYTADACTQSLKTVMAPVMGELLKYKRSGHIHNALQAAAVTAASFEEVQLSAIRAKGDEYDLAALLICCAKSYRGKSLTPEERTAVMHAATAARRLGGLYRAMAFKLMGLMNDSDRDALRAPFLSLAVDALTVAKWASALEEPDKTLVVSLFCGSKIPDIAQVSKGLVERGLFSQVAAYALLRTRLLGIKLRAGRLYCEPSVPTLKQLVVAGQTVDITVGGEVCIMADGVKYYTTVLPKKSGLTLIGSA